MLGNRSLVVALAVVFLAAAGCFSRRGGTVGPFPEPSVPGTIVFVSTRDEGHGEIYSMRDDGTHVTRLTWNGVQDAAPLLSPDGTKITFRRELNPSNVFLMNVDGSSAIGLAPGRRAEWSPDGSKLALVADSLGVLNADGTGRRFLPVGASLVTWSPDGAQLAYVSNGLGGQDSNDVYVIDANGSGARRITSDGVAKNSIAWSPDGARLLYSTAQGTYVMGLDGSGLASPCVGQGARWSPDGQRIIFATGAYAASQDIYTVRLDGSGLTNLSHDPANDSDPDWGPRN